MELDSQCNPRQLMAFRYSQNEFAIICAGLSIQFAEITANNRLKLHQPIIGPDTPGVLVESNKELFSISYLGQRAYEKYSYHSAQAEVLDLPSNVFCLDDDRNSLTLYPLHGQEKFLLYCLTSDGPTLYIVPLDTEEMTRGVAAHGYPHSSLDGSYISMVNGSRVTSFVTANQSVLPSVDIFLSRVNRFEFLSSGNALVLTEGGEHYVMKLGYGISDIRLFPGGLPLKWVWIPNDYYLYVTADNELYLFNETSKELEDMPKRVVTQPELLLFIPKYVPPTKPQPTVNSTPLVPRFNTRDTSERSIPTIVGSVFGGIVVMVIALVLIAGLVVGVRRCTQNPIEYTAMSDTKPHDRNPTIPLTERTSSPTEAGRENEVTFTQPPATTIPPDPITDGLFNAATKPPTSTAQATMEDTNDPVKRKSDDRRLTSVPDSQQILSLAKMPSDIEIQAGKTIPAAATPTTPSTKSPPIIPAPTNLPASPVPTTAFPSPPGSQSSHILPFRENPSLIRDTSTAESAFVNGQEETLPLHSQIVQ